MTAAVASRREDPTLELQLLVPARTRLELGG
jgi:hypothetical protein